MKWSCTSNTNCLASARARAAARSGSATSADSTTKCGPNTSFMATKAAAIPAAVFRNLRRGNPCLRASGSASSRRRSSNLRCSSLRGGGVNSPLVTACVGMGDSLRNLDARVVLLSSSGVRKHPMAALLSNLRRANGRHRGPGQSQGDQHQGRVRAAPFICSTGALSCQAVSC